uniref:RING-type domain-containing protein n=1 Tax=Xiphophorus couchianus TaxID=32473 RepID=A0A3B5L0F4_9TELE
MAQRGISLDEDMLRCSICLDLLKDPVTIPCGHNYCSECIKNHWKQQDQKAIYSCPQCREVFTPRPVVGKMLAELVEEIKKVALRDAPCLHQYVGPGDEIFCRSDQRTICFLCSMDEHKGHDTVSAAAERTEWQQELGARRQDIWQRVQDREEALKLLQKEGDIITGSASDTVENIQAMFKQLLQLLAQRSYDIQQLIGSQQGAEMRQVEELQQRVQQEISELTRRDQELEKLVLVLTRLLPPPPCAARGSHLFSLLPAPPSEPAASFFFISLRFGSERLILEPGPEPEPGPGGGLNPEAAAEPVPVPAACPGGSSATRRTACVRSG